jgi:hypothetical protein
MKWILTNAAAGVLMLGLAGSASAGTITFGTGTGGNAFPFTATSYLGEYQQVYDASLFSGPVDITQITFFRAPGFASASISGNFTISLSTSSATVSSLSTVYANNIGPDNSLFFGGSVSNVLSFTGTPFLLDPSHGNLLLDLIVNTSDSVQSSLAAGCSTQTNRVFNFSGNSTSHGIGANPGQCTPNSYGLETQFTFTPAQVPEPSVLTLFGAGLLGLVGLGATRRRKLTSA